MSEDAHTTTMLPGRRMTEVLAEDQGEGRVRISHESGLPLSGDTRTHSSQALEEWESTMSGPVDVYKPANVGRDPLLLQELRKVREEFQTECGHKIDVRRSYELEYRPQDVSESKLRSVPEETACESVSKMRARPREVNASEPTPQATWSHSLLLLLVCMGLAFGVAWSLKLLN